MTKDQIKEMATVICNTWDFCGNEREAAKEWAVENNIEFSESFYLEAIELGINMWEESLEGM